MKRCRPSEYRAAAGLTLVELLCVICIIAILASLLLPAVAKAYARVRGFAEEFEGEEVAEMLRHETRNYCAGHLKFQFKSKSDLADKCNLTPKPRGWIMASSTDFVPFSYLDATNTIVVQFHIGPKQRTTYAFTRGDLSIRPESR
jgi:prepilin-type N-terminal cleavage/methylation domain-containing protein